MDYTLEQFKADVISECVALKRHATPEEIDKLRGAIIEPTDPEECIYGTMTGNCTSLRAIDLIYNCSTMRATGSNGGMVYLSNITGLGDIIKGRARMESRIQGYMPHMTALECYIHYTDAKIESILSFLTDQTQTLEL